MKSVKSLLLTVLFLIGICASSKAMPACITNIVVSTTQTAGPITTSSGNFSNGAGNLQGNGALLADSCTNGISITIPTSCPSGGIVAIVSWDCCQCAPDCGEGSYFTVRAPKNVSSITIRLFECGGCCIAYCVVGTTPCPEPAPSQPSDSTTTE